MGLYCSSITYANSRILSAGCTVDEASSPGCLQPLGAAGHGGGPKLATFPAWQDQSEPDDLPPAV